MEWLIGFFVFFLIVTVIFKPGKCDVCDTRFKRKYYIWEIEGKKQYLCPNCNGKMSRRVSARRFKDKFG